MAGVQYENGRPYVIVTRTAPNDCLTNIASTYCTGSDYKPSGYAYYKTLATINNIRDHNFILDGQKIYLKPANSGSSGSGSSSSNSSSSYSASKATVLQFGLQNNTDRTLYATWAWDKHSQTEHYRVRWLYGTGDGVSFVGSDTTTTERQATYTIPQEATTRVIFLVLPISKTKKDANGNETKYFTADWSNERSYYVSGLAPSEANAPEVDPIKDNTLTARLKDVREDGVKEVQFQVVQDDKTVYKTGTAKVITEVATYTCTVATGSKYKVRCRYVKGLANYGEWSPYSDNKETPPAAPSGITSLKADSATSIAIGWGSVTTATGYTVEYTTDKRYFDANPDKVTSKNYEGNSAIVSDLTSGQEYFFRVKATNDSGSSSWTPIKSIVIGEPPSAPTTWSSTTTAIVGETVTLFWIHNSEDGSSQTWADLEVYVNGSLLNIPDIPNTTDEDLKDATSSYAIPTSILSRDAKVLWRVRTKGVTNEWGDWSIQRTIDVYEAPSLSLKVANSKREEFGTTIYYKVNKTDDIYTDTAEKVNNVYTKEVLPDVYTESGKQVYKVVTTSAEEFYCYIDKNVESNYVESFPIYVEANAAPTTQKPLGYHLTVNSNEAYETTDVVGNIKMVNKGEEIYSRYFETNLSIDSNPHLLLAELSAGNIDLHNNISYTVTCVVAMDSGLTAESSATFTVTWTDALYQPNAEIAYDKETFVAHIRPYCENRYITCNKVTVADGVYTVTDEAYDYIYPDQTIEGAFTTTGEQVYYGATENGDEIYFAEVENVTSVEGVLLSVYRREFDGSFVEIIKDIDGSLRTFVTDPHPALDYARYRIVAKDSATGAISYYDMPGYPIGETSAIIQWDEEWSNFETTTEDALVEPPWTGSLLKLPYNIDISPKNSIDVEFVEYIGRKRPVDYYGTQLGETDTWSATIPKSDKETLYALRRLAIWTGKVYAREPSGTGYWASVSVTAPQKHLDVTVPVTIELTRVEGGM